MTRLVSIAALASVILSLTTSVAAANGRILWGAYVASSYDYNGPWDPTALSISATNEFEARDADGLKASIIPFYEPFTDCGSAGCQSIAFPEQQFAAIRSQGAIPELSWGSESEQDAESQTHTDPAFTLARIANGTDDEYLREWARAAAQWGHPFMLRFDWEMNGFWYDWASSVNTNSSSLYVRAWRHVHTIFEQSGATNVRWVWCPEASNSSESLSTLYPGSGYVDWTCLDAYNYGPKTGTWTSWGQIVTSDYTQLVRLAPAKPILIAEFGSMAGTEGEQADWITDVLTSVPRYYTHIRGLILFDANLTGFPSVSIDSDPAAVSAFRNGISNPGYASAG